MLVLAFLGLLAAYLLYTGIQYLNGKNWMRGFTSLASAALLVLTWFHVIPRLSLDPAELQRLQPQVAKLEADVKTSSMEAADFKAKFEAQSKAGESWAKDKMAEDNRFF